MTSRYPHQLFTPPMKAAQEAQGSRRAYARRLTPREKMFVSVDRCRRPPCPRGRAGRRDHRAKVERGSSSTSTLNDWNCPQHITRRYAEDEIDRLVKPLQERIAELEATLAGFSCAEA